MAEQLNQVKTPKQKPTPLISDDKSTGGSWDTVNDLFGGKKDEYAIDRIKNAKSSWLARQSVATPFKAWRKGTVAPIGSAVALAALAGVGAYYGAPWAAKKIRSAVPDKFKPDMSEEEISKMRNRMALLAALGVGGLSVATNLDMRNPWGSMTNWNYGIPKKAMLGDWSNPGVMSQELIPLDHAKEIVANDKYLTSGQKAAIGTIFDNTPGSKDVSMADITSGAIRSGLGFVGGAVTGYALGRIFALPASITRAASLTGGLAGALRSSGLIS